MSAYFRSTSRRYALKEPLERGSLKMLLKGALKKLLKRQESYLSRRHALQEAL
jgi:hypothetical protein